MTIEEKLDEFIKQSNIDRQRDLRKANKERLENLSYIMWGFALATLSLAVAGISQTSTITSIIVTVAFVVLGWVEWVRARRWR
jgi:Flp pilus assembly protein TadB